MPVLNFLVYWIQSSNPQFNIVTIDFALSLVAEKRIKTRPISKIHHRWGDSHTLNSKHKFRVECCLCHHSTTTLYLCHRRMVILYDNAVRLCNSFISLQHQWTSFIGIYYSLYKWAAERKTRLQKLIKEVEVITGIVTCAIFGFDLTSSDLICRQMLMYFTLKLCVSFVSCFKYLCPGKNNLLLNCICCGWKYDK